MMTRRRYFHGAPIMSKSAARANLRRHIAEAVDGKYHHPAGGVTRKCLSCGGAGVDGFDGTECSSCHGTGVIAE